MSITLRRPMDPTRRHRRTAFALALVLASGLLAGLAPIAHPATAAAASLPKAPTSQQPSILYEDAIAHANDRIAFAPGDRVSVSFKPRAGDTWRVGGVAPRTLPSGLASGRALRDVHAPEAPQIPADRPAVLPSDVVQADPALWSSTDGDAVVEPAAVVSAGGLRREVFGFLPYWEVSASDTRLDWAKLSTVAYFGVGATATGGLLKTNADGSSTVGWSGWTSSKMTSIINDAHAHHTRVVLTVQSFAWTSSQLATQKTLLGSATARSNLARQIAAAVRARGADGANLDFEPIASGYADEFTALVRSVRAELDKVAKGYQLTFDATGYIGNYPIEDATAAGGADAVFVMGYDYRSSASSPVGSVAPIGGALYDVGDTVRAYTSRIPASKVILGVPYYGRAWSTASNTLNAANTSGAKNGTSVTVLYETARDLTIQNGRHYDAVEGVAWTAYKRDNCTTTYGCVSSWRELYYDDATALKAKYDLVNSYGLRGAGIWALGYDGARPELYAAIEDKFITDSIPPVISASSLSTTSFSPNGDGRQDTVVAKLTATGLDKWGYLVQPLDGTTVGAAIRSGTVASTSVAWTWTGTRADATLAPDGVYRITIWTADESGNRAERQLTVTIDTVPATVGSTTTPSVISPNGDRRFDLTTLGWSASQRVTGTGRIVDRLGKTVRAWTLVPGTSGATTWDGHDAHGVLVNDGRYVYRVIALDPAGNPTARDMALNVDRTIASIAWSSTTFDPVAGQSSKLSFRLIRAAKVTVAIYQGTTLVRTIWTDRALTAGTWAWTWDGRNAAGARAKPGSYTARVLATSWVTSTRLTQSVTIRAH